MSEQTEPFYTAYRGAFSNLLRWHELDAFWAVLKENAKQQWYIYNTEHNPPEEPVSEQELLGFIDEIDSLLHKEHDEDYCGIVYVDDRTAPSYVKIYNPRNLGVVCGIGREPIFPGWIISRLEPRSLAHLPPLQDEKKGWWRRLIPGL